MAHATIKVTILPQIIRLICGSHKVTEKESMDMFYSSATGASVRMAIPACTDNLRYIFTDYLQKK